MQENENKEIESRESEEIATAAEEDIEMQDKAEEQEKKLDKLFTLKFRLPLEDYYQFHLIMGRENVQKNRRKTTLLGALELVFGIGLLISILMSKTEGGLFYYFIVAILILMGAYGMCYYRFIYKKSLRKALEKQYTKVAFLQNDIMIDFYPNKFVEHNEEKEIETFWHTIQDIRMSETLIMIMLNSKRCMLIPRSQLGGQAGEMETLIKDVCTNYEKKRYDI